MKRVYKIPIVLSILLFAAIGFAQSAAVRPAKGQALIAGVVDQADIHNCTLTPVDKIWRGSCGHILNSDPILSLTRAEGITTGIWRKGVEPTMVWSGVIKGATAPSFIEIELYDKGTGILRGEFGWYSVSDFSVSAKSLQFKFDMSHTLPPSDLDGEILKRAAAILSSEAVWNRKDGGDCEATATSWSIGCALYQATLELTGVVHDRRPAFDLVRQVIRERGSTRNPGNPLKGYNNDPATKFSEVQSLFTESLARVNNPTKGVGQ
ncbi:MAG TPA: hypothetical protein VFC63_19225 [Blastocatellia bacterium]|nr:hypothetical protein [Blastocatellia bacterium]